MDIFDVLVHWEDRLDLAVRLVFRVAEPWVPLQPLALLPLALLAPTIETIIYHIFLYKRRRAEHDRKRHTPTPHVNELIPGIAQVELQHSKRSPSAGYII